MRCLIVESILLAMLIVATPAWAQVRDRKAPVDPPTVRGKVTAYTADQSITIETRVRRDGADATTFSLVKDRTRIEGAIGLGTTVAVWADENDPKIAARVAAQAATPARRNRRAKPEGDKPAVRALGPQEPVDVKQVLEAYRANLPTAGQLEWYTLDWVDTLAEAKARAKRENRPILWIQTNKEGDLFCSLC